jgi:hypothetical protein
MITAKRLESGFWIIRGDGPCEWSQPPRWPCDEQMLRDHAFPEASEAFFAEAIRAANPTTGRQEP